MAAFKAGMNASYYQMARNLSSLKTEGRDTTIITNYPTHGAMALSTGGMVERGMALDQYEKWSKMKCGLSQAGLDFFRTEILSGAVDPASDHK